MWMLFSAWPTWSLSYPTYTIDGRIGTEMFATCQGGLCRIAAAPSEQYLVQAVHSKEMSRYGMDRILVRSSKLKAVDPCVEDTSKMYMAGVLEGAMTVAGIDAFLYNIGHVGAWNGVNPKDEEALRQWWADMEAHMLRQSHCLRAVLDPTEECAYWYQILLAYSQLKGMTDGYNSQKAREAKLTTFDFFRINSDGAIDSMISGIRALRSRIPAPNPNAVHEMGRCSAMVKLTDQDIFMSHSTWEGFEEMVRLWKFYDLDVCGAQAKQLSFSSYPGAISSTDDFYITAPTMLTVQETTLSNSNGWEALRTHLVPDAFHILTALRLARNGHHFTELLVDSGNTKMSGMYNSQWMVVDYALWDQHNLHPGQPLLAGTFYVVEVAPGISVTRDETRRLETDRFWASVNLPVYPQIQDALGSRKSIESETRWMIFDEYQSDVKTIDDMKSITRFAQRKGTIHGKPATFDLASTPSARYDLYDGSLRGGVDAKIVGRDFVANMKVLVQAGPSHDNVPPFDFSLYPQVPHHGIPDGPLVWPWFIVDERGMHGLPTLDNVVHQTLHPTSSISIGVPLSLTVLLIFIWLFWWHQHTMQSIEESKYRAPFCTIPDPLYGYGSIK